MLLGILCFHTNCCLILLQYCMVIVIFIPHFLFVFIIINLYFYAFNLNILDFFWFMSFMVSRLYVFIFCCSSCFLVFSLSVIHFLFYFEAFCSLFCVFSFTSLYFITLIVFSCPLHPTCSLFQWLAYSVSVSINCPFVLCCVCFVFLPVVCLWDFLGGGRSLPLIKVVFCLDLIPADYDTDWGRIIWHQPKMENTGLMCKSCTFSNMLAGSIKA